MRLIDSDALKEALSIFNDGDPHFLNGIKTAREIIDDAPAIDSALELMNYSAGYEDGIKHAENQNAVEPIRSKDADVWYCGNCVEIVGEETLTIGGIQEVRHKYCPECGRKVKWDEAD